MTTRLPARVAGLLTALLMALGLSVTATAPAHAARPPQLLGSVSIQGACDNQIAPGLTAKPVYWNVYGWRCVLGRYSYGISVNQQCAAQHGSGAYAGYVDYGNPYSWRCYR